MFFCVFFVAPDPPKDSGGSDVTKYVAELSEGLSGMFQLGFLVCLHMLSLILPLCLFIDCLCVCFRFFLESGVQRFGYGVCL